MIMDARTAEIYNDDPKNLNQFLYDLPKNETYVGTLKRPISSRSTSINCSIAPSLPAINDI